MILRLSIEKKKSPKRHLAAPHNRVFSAGKAKSHQMVGVWGVMWLKEFVLKNTIYKKRAWGIMSVNVSLKNCEIRYLIGSINISYFY